MITAANPSFILTNLCSAFTSLTFKLTLYIVHELDGARLQVSHRIRYSVLPSPRSLAQWRLQTFAPGWDDEGEAVLEDQEWFVKWIGFPSLFVTVTCLKHGSKLVSFSYLNPEKMIPFYFSLWVGIHLHFPNKTQKIKTFSHPQVIPSLDYFLLTWR